MEYADTDIVIGTQWPVAEKMQRCKLINEFEGRRIKTRKPGCAAVSELLNPVGIRLHHREGRFHIASFWAYPDVIGISPQQPGNLKAVYI